MPVTPEIPADDEERLAELRRFDVLDTPPDERFDRLTRLVADLLDVPIALVSLVDRDRQWFKAKVGLDVDETRRDVSFCAHAILGDDVFVVPDAARDERFADNPLVTGDPSIRFYAGAPLRTRGGFRVGTLCAIDRIPRELSDAHRRLLVDLADVVVDELELQSAASALLAERRALIEAHETARRAAEANERLVRGVSHELRTPVHAVSGLLEVASAGDVDDDVRQLIVTARRSVARLETTVNRLIEDGRLPLDAEKTDEWGVDSMSGTWVRPVIDEPRGSVLVVEDDPVNRMLMVRQLTQLGYECETAVDGFEALESIGRRRPDVILADWQMPGIDGVEMTVRIRRREQSRGEPKVPIVAVTASAMPGDRERCEAAGMDDFLAKPVGIDELARVLSLWCPTPTGDAAGIVDAGSSAVDDALDALVSDLGARSTVESVAAAYLRELPGRIRSITSSQDPADRAIAAHTLRSSSSIVGLEELASMCLRIENDPADSEGTRIALVAEHSAAAVQAWIDRGAAARRGELTET